MTDKKLTLVSYRDGATVEALEEEIRRLKSELARARGEQLLPFSGWHANCRKCGAKCCQTNTSSLYLPPGMKADYHGQDRRWYSYRAKSLFRSERPEHFVVSCRFCGGVYYELPYS